MFINGCEEIRGRFYWRVGYFLSSHFLSDLVSDKKWGDKKQDWAGADA